MKYKLTTNTKIIKHPLTGKDVTLYQIQALKEFILINSKKVNVNDFGGWIEKEENLSQDENCWVYDECCMFDNAIRQNDSIGYEDSMQYGNSMQYGDSRQSGNSEQYDGIDSGEADTLLQFKSPTSGRNITLNTLTGTICTGCFHGSALWMIDKTRVGLPEDHWAFRFAEEILNNIKNLKSLKDYKL